MNETETRAELIDPPPARSVIRAFIARRGTYYKSAPARK